MLRAVSRTVLSRRAPCRAPLASYRGACPVVSQRPRARWLAVLRASLSRIMALYCAISQRSAVISRPKVAPQPRYKSLYRDPAPNRAHCAPCHACAWLYLRPPSRIVAEQWSYRGLLRRVVERPWALPPSLAYHDTMHHIVTQHQNGQWPISGSTAFFFFTLPFFFFHFSYWENHPKKKKKFHFPVEPNKFIKIYFILFFPVLHTVKPKKKKTHISPQHCFFFFFLCAIHQAHNSHNIHNNHMITHQSSKCTRDT